MWLAKFRIQNFKLLEDLEITFNKDLNILTGTNNSGKTTILEAIALWHECFEKLIYLSKKGFQDKYNQGDYIFTPNNNRYFNFEDIQSLKLPNIEDLFYNRNTKNKVILTATFIKESDSIDISFKISSTLGKYLIEPNDKNSFDYKKFNRFFLSFPYPIDTYYASPVAFIEPKENFQTDPYILDIRRVRRSSQVIRNRIYKHYHRADNSFSKFTDDLSFILFDHSTKIKIDTISRIQTDKQVEITYTIGDRDSIPKDLSLLGSGTLQIIEILLNIYEQTTEKKDLKFILLDEPDSHIHRHVQKRLLTVLLKFTEENQIFITTHNESFIREAKLHHIFHIDGTSQKNIKSLYSTDLTKVEAARFTGFYPSNINPLLTTLGSHNGLDFINAIESDVIIFIEGKTDARVIHSLLQKKSIEKDHRKFMFWVLDGISHISKLKDYRPFFEQIKNEKNLWEKSCLILDQDNITDLHCKQRIKKFGDNLNLTIHCWESYTLESILFTDLNILSRLLNRYLQNKKYTCTENSILEHLKTAYEEIESTLKERYNLSNPNDIKDETIDQYINKLNYFHIGKQPMQYKPITIRNEYVKYHQSVIEKKQYYKLMDKKDVEDILNDCFKKCNVSTINIEKDFYSIIECIGIDTWYEAFNFLKKI